MKSFIVFFSLFLNFAQAKKHTNQVIIPLKKEIKHLISLNNKKTIHKKILKLKKTNLDLKKKILKEKSYQPINFSYILTLEYLLENVSNNIKDMPSCSHLKNTMMDDYKASWNDLDPPSHNVWKILKKICKS